MVTIEHFSDHRYLIWLKFWQQPWREMDESWWNCLPHHPHYQVSWQDVNPEHIRAVLALDPAAPPMPGDALLQWVAMTSSLRQTALNLAAEVVIRGHGTSMVNDADIVWCRHLARALMPGRWDLADYLGLNAADLGMVLLREWMSAPVWHRVRLCYPKAIFDTIADVAPALIPSQRLNQLWHGVMWRLSITDSIGDSVITGPSIAASPPPSQSIGMMSIGTMSVGTMSVGTEHVETDDVGTERAETEYDMEHEG